MQTKTLGEFEDSPTTAESANNDRPDECQCWNADLDLACWPCYREGFETQNPAEPAVGEDDD